MSAIDPTPEIKSTRADTPSVLQSSQELAPMLPFALLIATCDAFTVSSPLQTRRSPLGAVTSDYVTLNNYYGSATTETPMTMDNPVLLAVVCFGVVAGFGLLMVSLGGDSSKDELAQNSSGPIDNIATATSGDSDETVTDGIASRVVQTRDEATEANDANDSSPLEEVIDEQGVVPPVPAFVENSAELGTNVSLGADGGTSLEESTSLKSTTATEEPSDEITEAQASALNAFDEGDRQGLVAKLSLLTGWIRSSRRDTQEVRRMESETRKALDTAAEMQRTLEDDYELQQNTLKKTNERLSQTQKELKESQSALQWAEVELGELQEERRSLRKLGKQAWRLGKSRAARRWDAIRNRTKDSSRN